jgi:hypothetical protein
MKLLLILMSCLISMSAFSKNKILFTTPNADRKKPDDLNIILDYKKGSSSKKLIDTQVGGYYGSTEEFVVYLKEGGLIIVKDFDYLAKNAIASNVVSFKIDNGNLYYETMTQSGIKTLWLITDFKNLKPIEIVQGYNTYGIDQ